MEIRYITPTGNRGEISRIYEESWRYAYKGIIPQHYLDAIPAGQWAGRIDSNALRQTLLCLDGGRMVGTSSFGRSRLERLSDWGEVISLYLMPECIGRGYGERLLAAVVAELQKQGYGDAYLWVLEENRRARRFYERFGFAATDDFLDTNIGGRELREVRYIYSLR